MILGDVSMQSMFIKQYALINGEKIIFLVEEPYYPNSKDKDVAEFSKKMLRY